MGIYIVDSAPETFWYYMDVFVEVLFGFTERSLDCIQRCKPIACIFVKLIYSCTCWALLFYTISGRAYVVALCICMCGAAVSIILLAYRFCSFLCSAITWGKAWHEYHYPARIPLEQRLGLTAISVGDSGVIFVGSSTQIPVLKVQNAKSRHAAK